MSTLIFATNNQHKVDEIRKIIGNGFYICTLKEAGILIDIPEPYHTLRENATTKSSTIFKLTEQNCFSEDTGLFIDALNGEPGVHSARYAGIDKSSIDNINLVLEKLGNSAKRAAHFKTVISLLFKGEEYFFEGICEGQIIEKTIGISGFGYDPIFMPTGSSKTFAEMSIEEKNIYSHRRKATDGLIQFLSQSGTESSK